MSWRNRIFPDRPDAELVVFGREIQTVAASDVLELTKRLNEWCRFQRPGITIKMSVDEDGELKFSGPNGLSVKYEYPVFEELVLRARIWLFSIAPEFPVNWIEYPIAFHRYYHRASHREFALEEFERFRPFAETIKTSGPAIATFQSTDPTRLPAWRLEEFFRQLISLYEATYRFREAIDMSIAQLSDGLNVGFPIDAFRKSGSIEEGVAELKRLAADPPTASFKTDWIPGAIYLLRRQQDYLRAYKRRPRKVTSLVDESSLIRYRGPMPSLAQKISAGSL